MVPHESLGAQIRQMAVDPCDGDLSPGGASRNLREEVGALWSLQFEQN
jgi:hypothetical protein